MIEDKLNDPIKKLSVQFTMWEENSVRQNDLVSSTDKWQGGV